MNKHIIKISLISVGVISFIASAVGVYMYYNADNSFAARREDWIAGNIISDATFTDNNAMSVQEIQNFLDEKINGCDIWGTGRAVEYSYNGTRAQYAASRGWSAPPYTCLNRYYEVPKTTAGGSMPANNYSNPDSRPAGSQSAAWIIKDAADRYNISPKVLLVKIATESLGPLTSDKWPLFSQYRYAMGSHCPDSGPNGSANCDPAYSGFSIQMYSAAELMRWYLDGMNQSWWPYKKPGDNRIMWNVAERGCGDSNVTIQNKATAALYTYTPYQPNNAALNNMYGTGDNCSAYGNRNFWRVYWDWFGDTRNSQPYRWSLSAVNLYSDAARTNLISDNGQLTLQPGQVAYATVTAENIGTSSWDVSTILETTNQSVIRGSDWIAYNKTSVALEGAIPTGSKGTYNFSIKAPMDAGVYTQYLNLHHNTTKTWFNSADLSIRINTVAPIPHPGMTKINRLATGENMKNGETKYSPEKHSVFRFVNGEAQLYTNFEKVWSTSTKGDGKSRLVNQGDGNLVIYDKDNKALWASDSDAGAANLSIQTDGNSVLYRNGQPTWATNTNAGDQLARVNTSAQKGNVLFKGQKLSTIDRKASFVLQGDGNFVLYNRTGRALWASNTEGKNVDRAVFQSDGNLVLYTLDNKAIWASNTDGRDSQRIVIQNDLNVVMYDSSNRPTWATNTAGR